MSPPKIPGFPDANLRQLKEVDARRSQHDLRAESDSEPPAELECERPSRVEQEEFGKAVHVRYGKLRLAIPLTLAGVLLGGGGLFGVQKLHQSTPESAALSASAHDALNAEVIHRLEKLEAKIDANKAAADTDQKLLIQRVGTLETNLGATNAGVQSILGTLGSRR